MKLLTFISSIIIVISGCQRKDNLKNVRIVPKIYSSRDTLFLEWSFKNSTSKNLIIPTLFTFKRLDGDDHRKYEFKEDYQIASLDHDKNRKIVVPYKYLKQIPDFRLDTGLHKQVENLEHVDDDDYVGKNSYNYIKNLNSCPPMVFVKANSEKQLIFMLKPGIKGKYRIGFIDKKTIESTSTLQAGDSLWKKGFVGLKDIISNRIDDYSPEYGEFTLDSVQVDL